MGKCFVSVSAELRARVALEQHGFRTAHSLGQNFLFDEGLLNALLDRAGVTGEDRVLEIGPGPGVMTAQLARRCEKVVSLEIDEKLRPVLETVLEGVQNVRVIYCDAMKADIGRISRENLGEGPFRVVANLPYYITTDVLLRLATGGYPIRDISVMVQKEAAQRILSRPGEKQWCAAAAVLAYFGQAQVLEEVPRDRFEPAPHVDSAFLRIEMYEEKPVQAQRDDMMLKTIHAAFLMRRKKLSNNLKAAFSLSGEQALAVLQQAGLSPDIRGEVLTMEELARLSDVLSTLL